MAWWAHARASIERWIKGRRECPSCGADMLWTDKRAWFCYPCWRASSTATPARLSVVRDPADDIEHSR